MSIIDTARYYYRRQLPISLQSQHMPIWEQGTVMHY